MTLQRDCPRVCGNLNSEAVSDGLERNGDRDTGARLGEGDFKIVRGGGPRQQRWKDGGVDRPCGPAKFSDNLDQLSRPPARSPLSAACLLQLKILDDSEGSALES